MYEGFNAVGMTARPLCRPIRGRAGFPFALRNGVHGPCTKYRRYRSPPLATPTRISPGGDRVLTVPGVLAGNLPDVDGLKCDSRLMWCSFGNDARKLVKK